MNKIEAQIHLWPWSVEIHDETVSLKEDSASFPFYGSSVISLSKNAELLLSSRLEKFRPFGCSYEDLYQIYETPHGVLAGTSSITRIKIRIEKKMYDVNLKPIGFLEKYISAVKNVKEKNDSELSILVSTWAQVFDDLLESKVEGDKILWPDVLHFLDSLSREIKEPRKAIIVTIAQLMRKKLPNTVSSVRRILLRERELVPIHRMQEIDSNCLRWIIRQPGETMEQKGGNKQRLLAVTRKSYFNTLENQILKDFLLRCQYESARYLQNESLGLKHKMKSNRFSMVQGYKNLCNGLLKESTFEAINEPPIGVQPNYVLQNDLRYKEIWFWYKKLLKKQHQEDSLWDWQPRLWADIVRLLISTAFQLFLPPQIKNVEKDQVYFEPLVDASFNIRLEQERGARLFPESLPGPFVVSVINGQGDLEKFVLELVHPDLSKEHPIISHLTRIGAHLYLVLHNLKRPDLPKRVLAIWAINSAGVVNGNNTEMMAESAYKSLEEHKIILKRRRPEFPQLSGAIISSRLNGENKLFYLDENTKLPVLEINADPRNWRLALNDVVILFKYLMRRDDSIK